MLISPIHEVPDDLQAPSESQPVAVRGYEPHRLRVVLPKITTCIRRLELHSLKEQVQFVIAALRCRDAFMKLADPPAGGAMARLLADRPRYLSLLVAPYLDARWSSAERVDRLVEQATALRGRLRKYDFSINQSLYLLDLNEIGIPSYSVIIDKPEWFRHEGLLTLNLCHQNFRLFSVTFSFCTGNAAVGIVIGGMQGRKSGDILEKYREFTKLAFGLRPRDFLIEILRIIARAENAQNITGIPDAFRYNRHAYFAKTDQLDLFLDYDEVWKDRGGLLNEDGMYHIPLIADRAINRISPKKRSQYRQRYAFLDQMEDMIALNLEVSTPVDWIPLD